MSVIDEIQARHDLAAWFILAESIRDYYEFSAPIPPSHKDRATLLAILAEIVALDTHDFINYKPSLAGRRFVDHDELNAIINRPSVAD